MGHMKGILWVLGISPQGNVGAGMAGNHRSVSGISSNPK
jgi:hypothetical protein